MSHLARQRTKLRIWVRSRLWAKVLLAMVLGIGVGTVLGPASDWLSPAHAEAAGAWLALPSQLFLGMIAIVLVPLVFSSIVLGLTGTTSETALRRVGGRLAGFVLASTFAAAAIGVTLANLLRPGSSFAASAAASLPEPAQAPLPRDIQAFDLSQLPELVAGVVPTNPAASFMQGDLLAIVLLALLDRPRREPGGAGAGRSVPAADGRPAVDLDDSGQMGDAARPRWRCSG